MSAADYLALLPLLILGGGAILSLVASTFSKKPFPAFIVSAAAALASLVTLCFTAPRQIGSFLSFSGLTLFTFGLVIAATLVTAIAGFASLTGRKREGGEFFFLLLSSAVGACVLSAASSFAAFFLGLELLSVTLFALIAYQRNRLSGVEAGIKYLILAGVSSGFLLFGMALIYAALGTMDISRVAQEAMGHSGGFLVPVGLCMMAVAIGFKLAVVPFHFWTPDVYDGAPSAVAGYIATASKGAMAVLLIRVFAPSGVSALATFFWVFAAISGVTMFTGNLLALRETNIRRILAYSSIAHLGYLLIAFVASGTRAVQAVAFFLTAYFASTLTAFLIVGAQSSPDREADQVEDYQGLAARRPWLAASFTAALLSLAGLPLTAGFMGKFVIFRAGEGSFLWVLAVLLAVNSTISLFYYLRIVSVMYRTEEPANVMADRAAADPPAIPLLTAVAVAVVTLAIIVLGVYPTPLMDFIRAFAGG